MNKKIIKFFFIFVSLVILTGGIFVTYLWFKPHRDVQNTKAFSEMTVNQLTKEFFEDPDAANAKYLSADGNSKVLLVTGSVREITVNQNGETVIQLREHGAKSGVIATFRKNTHLPLKVKVNDIIRLKGAITAGNSYVPDLDLYEDAVLVECDLVKDEEY